MFNVRTISEIEESIINDSMFMAKHIDDDSDRYEQAVLAAGESEIESEEELRNYYPHAFDRDFVDEELLTEFSVILDMEHTLSPEKILNCSKITDSDKIYTCKVRSFHNNKFVNNYIHIYLDETYTNQDKKQYDAECTCAAVCYALGHEFVAVLDITDYINK